MEMTDSETNKRKCVDWSLWISSSAVVNSLEVICAARTGWNAESAANSKGLFHSIMKFEISDYVCCGKEGSWLYQGIDTVALEENSWYLYSLWWGTQCKAFSCTSWTKHWYYTWSMISGSCDNWRQTLYTRTIYSTILWLERQQKQRAWESPEKYYRMLVTVLFIDRLVNCLVN